MPRTYRMGARAEAAEATRDRVVHAARDLLVEEGFHRMSVDAVAARADVARATVYQRFGSKAGLLEAVLVDLEGRAGLAGLAELVATAPPDRLVAEVVTAGCRYWATDPDLCRMILAVATADPATASVLRDHDAGRRTLLQQVVARLGHSGDAADEALDVLWVLTSFDAFDLLSRDHRAAAERLTTMALRSLPPAANRSGAAEDPR
ncbi:TetR/AcrR family transcriptional regulator [Luteipulveratus sp. YIM 133132]|uniref:TetR/AcrR family transcriptional regulator n=1 Tax=Luteipulveratus flavus TaxID=3031728 RepID=A0ABT6CAN7_9MICO|nr:MULTISPECIES: TetR/AcrR family transcriptional regulator [unclassified Luteipulveratus]MDE9366699.1 TetR/AcrR family transcriptional regulator [Luteipulveratus sp. YIM 133132]MDF8265950.1 TetR/AcrR family transcriptional regulator [Luteipulveratus sp. YIM 133296]